MRHAHHGMAVTRRDPGDARIFGAMRDAHRFLSTSRRDPSSKPSGSIAARAVTAGEVAAGAGATGLIVGRIGHWNIPGTPVPVGLALGVAGHLAHQMGWLGKYGPHAANVANGALASWATMLGAGWGAQMRAKAGQPVGPITAGTQIAGCAPPSHLPPAAFARGPRPHMATEAELAGVLRGD